MYRITALFLLLIFFQIHHNLIAVLRLIQHIEKFLPIKHLQKLCHGTQMRLIIRSAQTENIFYWVIVTVTKLNSAV